MEAVGGEWPEEWARVRAVGEGVRGHVARPAEQEGGQGIGRVRLFRRVGTVQDERGGRGKCRVEGRVRCAEESSGADLGVEICAGEPPEASGREPGRTGEYGKVGESGPQGGPGGSLRRGGGASGGGPGEEGVGVGSHGSDSIAAGRLRVRRIMRP